MKHIRAEKLDNGFISLFCYATKTSGLYKQDGTYISGALRLSFFDVIKIINR